MDGEILDTAMECNNSYDEYAVALKKGQITVGHHYENMQIQIYKKFYLQKLKIFR